MAKWTYLQQVGTDTIKKKFECLSYSVTPEQLK